jgi:hypothetical protein
MDSLNDFLNELPVATLSFIAVCVLTVIAYISKDITYIEAMASVALGGGASFGIGKVRNEAGKGMR